MVKLPINIHLPTHNFEIDPKYPISPINTLGCISKKTFLKHNHTTIISKEFDNKSLI